MTQSDHSCAVYFAAPFAVEVREEILPPPAAGQVTVRTEVSAISAGTKLLFYRGQVPADMAVDASIGALAGQVRYPLKYGYAAVGLVVAVGPGVDAAWLGRRVFGFNPHESAFHAAPESLIPVPDDLSAEEAAFLPNMETAVNLVMDGAPATGEQVAVLGQGVVGLLTTALLARFPLAALVTLDRLPLRRARSLAWSATASLDPVAEGAIPEAKTTLQGDRAYASADLVYELSGNPAALDDAVALVGFNGRIVIGSWYGTKRAAVDLGGRFHRERLRLISSQVSTLAPEWSGRWSKARRLAWASEMLSQVHPAGLITHRFPVSHAADAYHLLDEAPGEAIQVVLTYS
ncbi:MAG: zinc-dependent alcohol dehydrogenase [Anaerolineae bacterium]